MEDTGYASYQDPRLISPDVNESEPEDLPLTRELRDLLDRADIDYSCGWHLLSGSYVNTQNVTHVLLNGDDRYVTVEEIDGELYVETDEECTFTPHEVAKMVAAIQRHGS